MESGSHGNLTQKSAWLMSTMNCRVGATLFLWTSTGAGSRTLVPFLTHCGFVDVAAVTGPEKASPTPSPAMGTGGCGLGSVESYLACLDAAPSSALRPHRPLLLILTMLIPGPSWPLLP